MIQQTTALRKVSALRKKIRVIRGGQGAGKTISILILLINHASSKADREILILSSELTKMRLTVIKDFVKLMKEIGIYEESRFLAGTLYKFPNGSFIKFIGLDMADVGKGLRSDVAYFNEVNKIDFESYRQVASRAKIVFADYNPDAEFFIDTDVVNREDCDFLQLTFMDNELLDPGEREEILQYKLKGYNEDGSIKNTYWANLWNVYGLGNIGSLQGVIFPDWQEIDSVPLTAKRRGYGLDFGFTNDPTAIPDVFEDGDNLYLDELLYEHGLTNPALSDRMQFIINKKFDMVADSADPKSIQDLNDKGWYNIYPAKKGEDSVRAGLNLMRAKNIFITKRSTNIIKEFRSYKWRVDKNGKTLNEPEDKNNHAIDAIRYVMLHDNQEIKYY